VFLDGWQYHKKKVGDDIAKRMAIARSGRFSVWSLTYDDIQRILEPGAPPPESAWSSALAIGMDQAVPTYERFGIAEHTSFHTQTAFEQLRHRLGGLTDDKLLRIGIVLALRVGAGALDAENIAGLKASPGASALGNLAVFDWPEAPELRRCWSSVGDQYQIAVQARAADLRVLPDSVTLRARQPCVVLRWGTEDPAMSDVDRRRLWQQWWQAANLLMPMTNAWVIADESCDVGALAGAPDYQAASGMTGEWQVAAACAASAVQGLLAGLFEAGVPAPEVGFELMGHDHCVAADCELAWPTRRVAVVLASGGESDFVAAGWRVFLVNDPTLLQSLIGLLK